MFDAVKEILTLQAVALVLAGYVIGSARLRLSDGRWQTLIHAGKAAALIVLARTAIGDFGAEPTVAESLVLLAVALAVLVGEAVPLSRLARVPGWAENRGVQLATVGGLVGSLLVVGWLKPGVLLATAVAVAALLSAKSARRASYLVPLVALVPVALQYAGLDARARQAAYVLLVIFLAVDFVRVLMPASNRALAARLPSLIPPTERVRPLAASGAVTAVALLVHLIAPASVASAVVFGVVAVSVAGALNELRPVLTTRLLRGTTRGHALYLVLTLVLLLPAALLLGHLSFGQTLLVAGITWAAAIVPLPADRYLLSTLGAGAAAYLLGR